MPHQRLLFGCGGGGANGNVAKYLPGVGVDNLAPQMPSHSNGNRSFANAGRPCNHYKRLFVHCFLGEVNESTGQRVNEFGSDKSDRSDKSDGNTIISKAKDYRLNFLTP